MGVGRRWLHRGVVGAGMLSFAAAVGVRSYAAWTARAADRAAAIARAPLPAPEGNRQAVWYFGKTVAEVRALLGADNRLVSIAISRAAPLRLDVAMVENTGTRKMSWWWLPGSGPEVTAAQNGSFAGEHEARLVSLAPYVADGTTYFAAIYLAGGGSDDRGWWWYFDMPRSSIDGLLAEHGARLVDLRSYSRGGTLYSLIMVPKGSASGQWWWYPSVDGATTRARLKSNHAVLTSVAPTDPAASTFDVVMGTSPAGSMPAYDNVSWAWATEDSD
jgi:hypothetical protein